MRDGLRVRYRISERLASIHQNCYPQVMVKGTQNSKLKQAQDAQAESGK
jgi:hypothetical protein